MRVASDIGGTFTDLVCLDEKTGRMGASKASTTPRNFAEGVVETLTKAHVSAPDASFFVHGCTVVINALTERKGAKTGLITTKGFRDVLEITRANRPDLYNMYYTKPKPFVQRRYRLEVEERVNYKGEELVPLNEGDVRAAVEFFKKEGIETIAVCFLHSYANPALSYPASRSPSPARSHRSGASTRGRTPPCSTATCLPRSPPTWTTSKRACPQWA
jgi:N-methylhydantoinase A